MYNVYVYNKHARGLDSTSVETWAEVVKFMDQHQNAAEIIVENAENY